MKRPILLLILLFASLLQAEAVLKEKDIEQPLSVLRQELTEYHQELTSQSSERRKQNEQTRREMLETLKRANQNSIMLYSQKSDYVFDLTYACHEATELYHQFQRQQLPYRSFLESNEVEIAKFDSLITGLQLMRLAQMGEQAQTDRNVALTLATTIRNTLEENRSQTAHDM